MKFKNIKRWRDDEALGGLMFFSQRMDELLWDFTLDTYKPMALNAPYLCKEALSLIENIEKSLMDSQNLRPVLDELLWSIQNDPIAKKLLDVPIEKYILLGEDVKLSEQKLRLDVLAQTLEPYRYLHLCFDYVSDSVKRSAKKSIDAACRSMVTTLVNIGVSKKYLHEKNHEYFFATKGLEISNVDQIDEFLKLIYPYSHQNFVYFLVSDLIETVGDSLSKFQIKLLDSLPENLTQLAEEVGFQCGPSECYVEIGPIAALDVYSAQENAATRMDNLSDLFTLFYHQQKIKWRPIALVVQCCRDEPVAVTLTKGAMAKPFDLRPEKASKELNRLLRNIAFPAGGASHNRFSRVADLHGIGVSTDIAENQLVTLWTAFETLIPSNAKTTKISNILESTIPFLMITYLSRLVQRFTHDLILWKPWEAKRILNSVPGVTGVNTLHRALALLAVKSNQSIRDDLYESLRDFHLLRFRAFQLSEILISPQKIKEILATHEKKVRWQIRRIYRTRNLIVHSGTSPSYLHAIIENGHDYLDQLIFDVMKLSCGEYRITKISQAFELTKLRYEKFATQLGNVLEFDANSCEFLCEGLDSLADFERQSWRDESETDNKAVGEMLKLIDKKART